MGHALLFPERESVFGLAPARFFPRSSLMTIRFGPSICLLIFLVYPLLGEPSKAKKERDTTTGKEFETSIVQSLEIAGYKTTSQVQVGTRPNGSKHYLDVIAEREDTSVLISLKWQQSSGTAEQKVPFELICLSEALKQARGKYQSAYLVLGGDGWTLKNFTSMEASNAIFA